MASPGRTFLIMFPPHNDPTANVSHQVTLTATGVWTSVTAEVLESSFVQHIFLSAGQSKTIQLPSSVRMTSDRSPHLLSVKSIRPVAALASFCSQTGCDHSLLHDVSSWGTHYYPVTPNFPNQTAVSQMVITSSDRGTAVDIYLSGEVLFEGNMHPKGSVLKLYIGVLQSVYLQSSCSLSGSELISKEAVGVVVGFTCSKHTPGDCSYGFAELKPVTHWSFDYVIPPLVNTGMSSSFLLAMATIDSDLYVTASTERNNVSLIGGVLKVIPVVTSDKIHITSDIPLQLVYFRRDSTQSPATLIVLPSVDDICHTVPMFDSGDMSEQQDNSTHTGDLMSGVKFSQKPDFSQLPDKTEPSSLHTDVGHYLSTMTRQLHPEACEKSMYRGILNDCTLHDGHMVTADVCFSFSLGCSFL